MNVGGGQLAERIPGQKNDDASDRHDPPGHN